ncbi:MAG: PilZ domain-containing protein [Planctomycetes bacterium]|nr:PilZ domain-containing protein [Planctomycetota bacterium]MCB9909127.1 PilZ domain-containing protein [Planctomycetota bacterium]MCB9911623.1 PilZ domain-containing protein [Planctomycetota bacterium]
MPPQDSIGDQDRYRVRTSRDEVEMFWNLGGDSIPTEIFGLSMDGVEFLANKVHVSKVQVGDRCTQVFYDLYTSQRVDVTGVVRGLYDENDLWRLEVHFTDQDSLAAQLANSPAWRYFNRRRHFRVSPRINQFQPVKIELEWPRYRGEHVLHDISAQGLSIRLARHEELEVPQERPIRARVQLPNSDQPLVMVLKKLHEAHTPSHRRIGFQIDPMRTAYIETVEERLVSAVMDWQRQAIQAKASMRVRADAAGTKRGSA